ncbi:response regulator [Pseudodesulfovibrio piezophilus]|uniref:Response regulator receiver modulated metal dependent phosphohydrolase n=1 Tax=Pseudodesulfovibrio piezophilus (strain DSM 21447 / JCM 15486 / C1TLV30) TaxID=1322246 RepID=M1WQ04_PSEP2|nr:response regulator [Pseudodesulfovibrio piezophilus]CCH48704.1 Response regulator receiver modulated metal dependent phosphohydrolase [Pseudodesulfovibrio piezophilus C1TLV30]
MTDDELIFAAETTETALPIEQRLWKLLVVDDDSFVHKVTRLVLEDYTFEGNGLEILSAFSAEEGKSLLKEHQDIAVILLDVVMETHQAGLDLAAWIRDELDNNLIRIILRTGQPGEAPEQEVIFKYDINDYKEKAELTSQKLATTVTTAIRSYRDLRTIERNRAGLSQIVAASPTIFRSQSLGEFASGVLTQLVATLSLDDDTVMARASGLAAAKEDGSFKVIASTGKYSLTRDMPLERLGDKEALQSIQFATKNKQTFFKDNTFVGFYRTASDSESVIYLRSSGPISEIDRDLIEVFSNNISAAYDNLDLHRVLNETQKDLLFILGDVVESRTMGMSNHARRVAEYSHLLALRSGMDTESANQFKLASPMHDIGKIGISDSILLKPSKLDAREFDIIKGHPTIGYNILKGSERPLMHLAAIIALEHHEQWNGEGYPMGLAGEEISLVGRITRVADVFDALDSHRPHKEPWPLEDSIDYMKQNRGTDFDPTIIDLFMENLDEILELRATYGDESKD